MRRIRFILPVLVLLLLTGPALAEEILYFTNGTSMAIHSHVVKGGMIHVDLGSDSFMAFPMYMVEKIEQAGKNVLLKSDSSGAANVIGGSPSGQAGSGGPGADPGAVTSKLPVIVDADTVTKTDDSGMAVRYPFVEDGAPNRRKLGVTGVSGRSGLAGQSAGGPQGGHLGSHRSGNRHVIGERSKKSRGKAPFVATPMIAVDRGGSGSKKGNSGSED